MDGVGWVVLSEGVGDDACAGLHLHVAVHPLVPCEVVEPELPGAVPCHRRRVGEYRLAEVEGDVRMGVHIPCDLRRARPDVPPVVAVEGVELDVDDVDGGLSSVLGFYAFHGVHGLDGSLVVAGDAQVVAV